MALLLESSRIASRSSFTVIFIYTGHESILSHTTDTFVESERREYLSLSAEMDSLEDGGVTIRVDPSSGFTSNANDNVFLQNGMIFVFRNPKNPNKNLVEERVIEELGSELVITFPEGGSISSVTLAIPVVSLNS